MDTDQSQIDVRMKVIKRKILVLSGKGGTEMIFMHMMHDCSTCSVALI